MIYIVNFKYFKILYHLETMRLNEYIVAKSISHSFHCDSHTVEENPSKKSRRGKHFLT